MVSYVLLLNIVITINIACVFFFAANTWKYTVHAIDDINNYPMHENPKVIDMLEHYQTVAILHSVLILLFDMSLLIVHNRWMQNIWPSVIISSQKSYKSIFIFTMAVFSINDGQWYNILISFITFGFAIIYHWNSFKSVKESQINNMPNVHTANATKSTPEV